MGVKYRILGVKKGTARAGALAKKPSAFLLVNYYITAQFPMT